MDNHAWIDNEDINSHPNSLFNSNQNSHQNSDSKEKPNIPFEESSMQEYVELNEKGLIHIPVQKRDDDGDSLD